MKNRIIPNLSDAAYAWSRDLVSIYIPAFASAYLAAAQIWGLPGGESVSATAVIVATFIGVIFKVNTTQRNVAWEQEEQSRIEAEAEFLEKLDASYVGEINVGGHEEEYSLSLNDYLTERAEGEYVTLKVHHEPLS